MSWLSKLIFGSDPQQTSTDRAYDASTQSAGAAATSAASQYSRDSAAFDPSQAFSTMAQGAYGDFSKNLGLQLRDLKGSATGAGRFDSGFFDEDQGQVVRNLSDDFANTIRQGALTASGQRLSQIQGEGNYALNESGMYNDLLSGQLDRQTAADNAKRQQRGGFWSSLLSAGGAAAGAHI